MKIQIFVVMSEIKFDLTLKKKKKSFFFFFKLLCTMIKLLTLTFKKFNFFPGHSKSIRSVQHVQGHKLG